MKEENKDMKTIQDFYMDTYGEKIVFDEVKKDGKYLVASKKQGKERFIRGGNRDEYERNSVMYYFLDTVYKKSTKMEIYSEGHLDDLAHHRYSAYSETKLNIYQGKEKKHYITAFNAYIDTSDASQVASFLSGQHDGAKYNAYSPKTEELFEKWHRIQPDEVWAAVNPKTRDIYEEYKETGKKEVKKGCKCARDLFDRFIDTRKVTNKLANVRNKLAKKTDSVLGTNFEERDLPKPMKRVEKVLSDKLFGVYKE